MGYLLVINAIGGDRTFSRIDDILPFVFIWGLVLVTFLIYYYDKISSKNKNKENQIDISIYETKDFFLQQRINKSSLVLTDKSTSVWIKILALILIIVIASTSMSRILNPSSIFWFF